MKIEQTGKSSNKGVVVGAQHIAMTEVVNGTQIINRGKIKNEVLIKGKLVNLKLPSGILLFGGSTLEQDSRTVLGRAGQSLSICLVLEGKLNFSYGDSAFELQGKEGKAHAVAVRLKHGIPFTRTLKLNQHIKKLHIVLTPEWFTLQGCQLQGLPLARLQTHLAAFYWTPSTDVVMAINNFFIEELPEWQIAFSAERIVSLILQQMLKLLVENNSLSNSDTEVENHDKPHNNKAIGLVVNYLEEQLHNDINLTELAYSQAMSMSSLQRKFKAEFGVTIAVYIKARRLEHVMAGIKSGQINCVAEAAYQAKYQHSSNFVTAFKKKFAVTPGELMQRYKN